MSSSSVSSEMSNPSPSIAENEEKGTDIPVIRRSLTTVEEEVLSGLITTLAKTESHFCCGGTIQLASKDKFGVFYGIGDDAARYLELPSYNLNAIGKLVDACSPASHGRGKDTVYDESYRLARELNQDKFSLTVDSMDILHESGVLASITAMTSPKNPRNGLTARLYKLNVYATGGFFKAHRDTPKSDLHIGTVVIALPVPFEGGALRVSHEGKEIFFDWGSKLSGGQEQLSFPWAFLFSDVEHEVLPVTSGTRISLTYDIFASQATGVNDMLPPTDATSFPLYKDLKAVLDNKNFLPEGGRVAVTLHMPTRSTCIALRMPLPAISKLCPVYTAEYEYYEPHGRSEAEIKNKYPTDAYGPVYSNESHSCTLLYTSDVFSTGSSYDEWEDRTKLLRYEYCARVDPELIWARKPTGDVWSESGHYIAYGNQASLETVYAAAALVLDIPAIGQFPRAFE